MVKTAESLTDKLLGRSTEIDRIRISLERELESRFPIATYIRSEDQFTNAFGGSAILRVPITDKEDGYYPTRQVLENALDNVYTNFRTLSKDAKSRSIIEHGPYYYIFIG